MATLKTRTHRERRDNIYRFCCPAVKQLSGALLVERRRGGGGGRRGGGGGGGERRDVLAPSFLCPRTRLCVWAEKMQRKLHRRHDWPITAQLRPACRSLVNGPVGEIRWPNSLVVTIQLRR